MDSRMDVDVKHLPDRARFEAEVEGQTAFLTYERDGDTVAMTHTIVPPPIEGRGRRGPAHPDRRRVGAGARGCRSIPQCSYVRAWLRKNA